MNSKKTKDQKPFSLEEKAKFIQKIAEEISPKQYFDEQYLNVKKMLDEEIESFLPEITLTVGIQNAYLG